MQRRVTNTVKIGGIAIGGGERIAVQSMLNAHYDDIDGNIAQAKALAEAGCDIIRIAVPCQEALAALTAVKKAVSLPLVADIHFDYRLAIASVERGADKIRINPGNIGDESRVKAVADCCKAAGVPIRVGVNSGSVEKSLIQQYGVGPKSLAMSALGQVKLLEKCGFYDIVVSAKSADPADTVSVNRILAENCDYPLHIGVTEAGTPELGIIKSAAAVGSLLLDGIGDTLRISLTGDVLDEVKAGRSLLDALGLSGGPTLISCPTCGRTRGPVVNTANAVSKLLKEIKTPIRVAVMGCEVNGPGEAKQADVGIAFGENCAAIFKNGEVILRVAQDEAFDTLKKHIMELCDGKKNI